MYPKGKIRPLVAIKTGVGLTRIPFLRGKIIERIMITGYIRKVSIKS